MELLAECSLGSTTAGVTTAAATAGLAGAGDSEVELDSELELDEEEDLLIFSLGTTAAPVIKFSLSPSLVTARGLSTDLRGAWSDDYIISTMLIQRYE